MLENTLRRQKAVLVGSVLVAGLCSLIYELLISTTTSYFLGDSIRQFSVTIGLYMAAMGVGAWLSRWIHRRLLYTFIVTEILLGMVGGLCVPILYVAYAYTDLIHVTMVLLIVVVGVLTGLEVPLLTRLLQRDDILSRNLSTVLSLDYLGGLLATLVFPFLLLPWLGVFQTSLVAGLVNIGLGFVNLWFFAPQLELSRRRLLNAGAFTVTLFLLVLLIFSKGLLTQWAGSLYTDRVVMSDQTPYQKIVMTQYKDDLRLFLNGNLQFSSIDEYRYHESLVHLPLTQHPHPKQVLVLGGGDGLAARELLRYPSLEHITLVDLDPEMIRLSRHNPRLLAQNKGSMNNPKVSYVQADAMTYLDHSKKKFDVIIADLPDPNNVTLARLYSREFYRLVRLNLTDDGVFVTQAGSPYFASRAYWTIVKSVQAAGFARVTPYHVLVPSFGVWGFVYASRNPAPVIPCQPVVKTRFLTRRVMAESLTFEPDLMPKKPAGVSTLDRPIVYRYYLDGWLYWH